MTILLETIHIFGALFLVLVVLLQSGRGGGMGAALGGAAGQIFGGRGASTFLTRVTTGAAILFFSTSLTLSMLSSRHRSVVQRNSGETQARADRAEAATAAQGREATDPSKQDASAAEREAAAEAVGLPPTPEQEPAANGAAAQPAAPEKTAPGAATVPVSPKHVVQTGPAPAEAVPADVGGTPSP